MFTCDLWAVTTMDRLSRPGLTWGGEGPFSSYEGSMQRQLIVRTQLIAAACTVVLFSGGCGDNTDPSDLLAGTYVATVFSVTPTGQAAINVLAAGGSLTIIIAANNTTSGDLFIPASINGGTAFNASMVGTATLTGTNVQFQQTADTFVRDLTWAFANNALSVSNQTAGSATHTITLTRQ